MGLHFLQLILLIVFIGWLGAGVFLLWNARGMSVLRPETVLPKLSPAPRVSIIMAARNEEELLPAALESLLKLDYPDYEIILVDDDSTDSTPSIADAFARRPEALGRLRVIHNHELPPGWRGKVHALSLAEKAASGDWVLATDADVVAHPALLRLAVALASRTGARLVSVTPQFEFNSFAERVVLPVFSFLLAMVFPPRLVNHPKSRCALGVGAFLLMRRDDLRALGGYARLRGTLVEDLRMAQMFKRHGRAIHLAVGRALFHTRMYDGWREMFEGLARTAFEGMGFSLRNLFAGLVVGIGAAVLPWAVVLFKLLHAFIYGASLRRDPTFLLAAAAAAISMVVYVPVVAFFGASPFYGLALPFATLFYCAAAVTSAALTVAGPGVRWKDRMYPRVPT
jgi:chlorobactene glucosyltransferase